MFHKNFILLLLLFLLVLRVQLYQLRDRKVKSEKELSCRLLILSRPCPEGYQSDPQTPPGPPYYAVIPPLHDMHSEHLYSACGAI